MDLFYESKICQSTTGRHAQSLGGKIPLKSLPGTPRDQVKSDGYRTIMNQIRGIFSNFHPVTPKRWLVAGQAGRARETSTALGKRAKLRQATRGAITA